MFLVPFPLVLALLLFLFAQSALAGPSKRGDWRQLSTGKTLSEAFGSEIYSWDSDINWDLCKSKKNKVKVWPRSRGRDNGKKISTAVRDVSKKGGGVVVLMKGEFNLYTAITLASNVCVRGQGRKKTVLKVAGEKKDVDKGVFRASYRKHITIAHLTIDGGRDITEWKSNAKKVKYGINLHATNYAWMKRVDVVGFSKSGFYLHGDDKRQMFHVAVEKCRSMNNGMDGFLLAHTHYASLSGSASRKNGRHGLMIADGDHATYVLRSRFVDNGRLSPRGCGIAIGESDSGAPSGVYALSNNVTRSRHAGVCVHSGESISLNRNRIVNMRDEDATCYDSQAAFKETNGVCQVASKREYRLAKVKGLKKRCPSRGIMTKNRKVCCARSCRSCKKKGCKKRGPNKSCCPAEIKDNMERPCKKYPPPCTM